MRAALIAIGIFLALAGGGIARADPAAADALVVRLQQAIAARRAACVRPPSAARIPVCVTKSFMLVTVGRQV